ncbi:hypothetical protein JYB87_13190 [Shewanella avicenniae]|uniref:Hook-length control protein FliK n=1 Tax=Shewanella avicenniae TaxID=2814294 RepID=A0ABX7QMM3_9GAMM|nr:hypothetical protein [Shewanella avicenniae]QSX32697.1 hypothetical protein JYB87_13190 [Shewanella avicenniae]
MKSVSETIPIPLQQSVSNADGNKTAPLLPVSITSPAGSSAVELVLQGQRFELINSPLVETVRQQLLGESSLIRVSNLAQQPMQATLLQLGEKVVLAVPKELLSSAKLTQTEFAELQTLAKRPQGYPLPVATIDSGKLSFPAGKSMTLPASVQLVNGDYAAKITFVNNRLSLELRPIQNEFQVQLAPAKPTSTVADTSTNLVADKASQSIVVAKNDLSQVSASWLHKLERTPWHSSLSTTTQTQLSLHMSKDDIINLGNANRPLSTTQTAPTPSEQYRATQHQADSATIKQTPIPSSALDQTNQQKADSATIKQTPIPSSALDQTNQQRADSNVNVNVRLSNNLSVNKINVQPVTFGNDFTSQVPESKPTTETDDKAELNNNLMLAKALNKMGLAAQTEAVALPKQSLATALMKALPALTPALLTELVDPDKLQQELTASLNFQPVRVFTTPPSSQSDAIAFMFQLLLGAKPNTTASSDKISQRLKQYLEALQNSSGIGGKLLEALERNRGLESMSHLVNSIRLFQQSSHEIAGQGFYFALPYQLDNHTEQFEGKFEYEDQQAKNQQAKGWRLQLKFALTSGTMLVNAFIQGKSLRLELTSSCESLLQRITTFESLLSNKLSQVGFQVDNIKTTMGNVPASVLPGDHVLVKVQV